jgi:capsular exopolysaccharide synthesis family protein
VDEVAECTGLQVIGVMPRIAKKDFSFDLDGQDTIEVQRVTNRLMQNSKFDELLGNDLPIGKQKTLLITSSIASEGKSTFAAYLAASVAMMQEAPVLLIDADLRRPTQHKLFKVDNQNGLANLLEQTVMTKTALRELLIQTNYSKLSLLPCGLSERKPVDLFSAKQFLQLLKLLKKDFPFIILDAPPVVPVNDALVLGRYVDSILYLVKAGETPRDVAKRGLELVKTSTTHKPGIIVNNLKEVLPYYYKPKYYKYDYAKA